MSLRRHFLLVLCLAVSTGAQAVEPKKPNIIFILADDLGIGDLGCYGQTKIKTPNIDRLATEGLRFSNFYSGNAVCAPSRCALLTGKHMGHAAVRDNMQREPGKEGQLPLPADTITVAKLLQKVNYKTGIIGKWGLGMPEDKSGPNDFGFDYSYGYLCQGVAHTFYPDHMWRNGKSEPLPGNPPTPSSLGWLIPPGGQTYAHDLMAEDALKFVRDNQASRFFLYLAFTIPHFSLQVPEDSMAAYDFPEDQPYNEKHYAAQPRPRAAYAGMVSRMDRDIGRLMAELKKLGLDENTVVFFTSDNGATFLAADTLARYFNSTAGFRGMKGELYEGGIRTPFIARWPGQIKPGTTTEQIGAFWDVLPTLCALAGVPATENDGVSLVPTLLGHGDEQTQHPYLYWEYHSAGSSQAARIGEWKGIRTQIKKNPQAAIQLYNLSNDPAESKDVAAEHPEVVTKMKEAMSHRTPSPVTKWNF